MAHDLTLWQTSSLITSVYTECSHFLPLTWADSSFEIFVQCYIFHKSPTFLPDETAQVSVQSPHLHKVKTLAPGSRGTASTAQRCSCRSLAFLARQPQRFRVVISLVSNNQWMTYVFKNYFIDEEMETRHLGPCSQPASARARVQSGGVFDSESCTLHPYKMKVLEGKL